MQLLISGNIIVAAAPKILYGVFDEAFEKWALFDEEDNVLMYYIDYSFSKVEDVELPSDYADGKYFFVDGEFVLNEEWQPPLPPAEVRIAELERQLASMWDEMAVAIEEGVNEV